jgi:hypothetical protein
MNSLIRIREPRLEFALGQTLEDPRDGLAFFGPHDATVYGVRAGVIGTKDAIRRFNKWVNSIQEPVGVEYAERYRPPFPGFEAVFRIPWKAEPIMEVELDPSEIDRCLSLDDRHIRIFETVDLFATKLCEAKRSEESVPDLWFVVIPDKVHKLCTPRAFVPLADRTIAEGKMKPATARSYLRQPSLFSDVDEDAEPYFYDPDFRRQLKGKLLWEGILTQIVKESTIAPYDFPDTFGNAARNLGKRLAEVAWNMSSATYYKLGARPWKLSGIRNGVCYIGLVYKNDEKNIDQSAACCAAQMFLDSGDGVVFKGRVGPWYTGKRGHYHLSREAAEELLSKALADYRGKRDDKDPEELFVHGRTSFNDDEWAGFEAAAGNSTRVVGVTIKYADAFRLYRRDSDLPVLRGLGLLRDEKHGFLATSGFVPRLQTYYGSEVPVPISITINRGEADIQTVMGDILALTKLNYNSCRHSDGLPVTLKFADAVGEILVSGPQKQQDPPLPFRHYI